MADLDLHSHAVRVQAADSFEYMAGNSKALEVAVPVGHKLTEKWPTCIACVPKLRVGALRHRNTHIKRVQFGRELVNFALTAAAGCDGFRCNAGISKVLVRHYSTEKRLTNHWK